MQNNQYFDDNMVLFQFRKVKTFCFLVAQFLETILTLFHAKNSLTLAKWPVLRVFSLKEEGWKLVDRKNGRLTKRCCSATNTCWITKSTATSHSRSVQVRLFERLLLNSTLHGIFLGESRTSRRAVSRKRALTQNVKISQKYMRLK